MANNKNSIANLKKFKKGFDQRRNYKGRPPLPELNDVLCNVLDNDMIEKVIESLHKAALKGNVKAIDSLLDRLYGKAKQSIDHTTQGEALPAPTIIIKKSAS